MDYGFSPNVSGPGVEPVFGGKSPSPRMERRTCVNSAGSLWPLVERSSDRGRGDNRQLIAIAVGIPGRTIPGSQQSSGACSGKLWEFSQQEICKTWYDMIWSPPNTYHPPQKKHFFTVSEGSLTCRCPCRRFFRFSCCFTNLLSVSEI